MGNKSTKYSEVSLLPSYNFSNIPEDIMAIHISSFIRVIYLVGIHKTTKLLENIVVLINNKRNIMIHELIDLKLKKISYSIDIIDGNGDDCNSKVSKFITKCQLNALAKDPRDSFKFYNISLSRVHKSLLSLCCRMESTYYFNTMKLNVPFDMSYFKNFNPMEGFMDKDHHTFNTIVDYRTTEEYIKYLQTDLDSVRRNRFKDIIIYFFDNKLCTNNISHFHTSDKINIS